MGEVLYPLPAGTIHEGDPVSISMQTFSKRIRN